MVGLKKTRFKLIVVSFNKKIWYITRINRSTLMTDSHGMTITCDGFQRFQIQYHEIGDARKNQEPVSTAQSTWNTAKWGIATTANCLSVFL